MVDLGNKARTDSSKHIVPLDPTNLKNIQVLGLLYDVLSNSAGQANQGSYSGQW